MARGYAKILTSIWQSKKFRGLIGNDRARLLYAYLHSCVQVNSIGCYSLPIGYAVVDLGWTDADITTALADLRNAKLIDWDEAESLIRIIDFIKHDPPTNPNHAIAMAASAKKLPDSEEKLAVLGDLLAEKHHDNEIRTLFESLSKAFNKGISLTFPLPSPLPDHTKHLSADADPSKLEPQPETKKTPYPEAFTTFWREYPTDALMSKKKTFEQWKRLSSEDREAAIAAIPGFKDHCRKNPTYRPVHAQRFLSERRFDGFVAGPKLTPEEIASNKDRADQLFHRGKYAEALQ